MPGLNILYKILKLLSIKGEIHKNPSKTQIPFLGMVTQTISHWLSVPKYSSLSLPYRISLFNIILRRAPTRGHPHHFSNGQCLFPQRDGNSGLCCVARWAVFCRLAHHDLLFLYSSAEVVFPQRWQLISLDGHDCAGRHCCAALSALSTKSWLWLSQ